MKKVAILVLVLFLAISPAWALAASTLRTEGTATLTIAPDRAVISVGYAGESPESGTAQQQTANAINAVIEAVKGLGIEEDDIATASLNIYPVYNYTDSGSQLRGYRVEHMLSITVTNLDQVGDVLDATLAAGANQANGITFASSHEQDVYLQALALAVEKAAAKADALAIASGVWLGGMEQINELTGGGVSPYARYAESAYDTVAGASMGSTIMTGELQVTASVELVYEIR